MASLGQTTEAVLGNLDAALRGEPQPSVSWSPSKSNLSVAPGTAELTTGVKSEDSVGKLPICSGSASEGQTTSCLSYSSTVVKHHSPRVSVISITKGRNASPDHGGALLTGFLLLTGSVCFPHRLDCGPHGGLVCVKLTETKPHSSHISRLQRTRALDFLFRR